MRQTASLAYDPESYDHMPEYAWDKSFNIDVFVEAIDQSNCNLWINLRRDICQKLGVSTHTRGCKCHVLMNSSRLQLRQSINGASFVAGKLCCHCSLGDKPFYSIDQC